MKADVTPWHFQLEKVSIVTDDGWLAPSLKSWRVTLIGRCFLSRTGPAVPLASFRPFLGSHAIFAAYVHLTCVAQQKFVRPIVRGVTEPSAAGSSRSTKRCITTIRCEFSRVPQTEWPCSNKQ